MDANQVAVRSGNAQLAAAIAIQTSQLLAGLAANKPVIQATTIEKTTTVIQRAGPTGGSRDSSLRNIFG
jgi:hypothetical protein